MLVPILLLVTFRLRRNENPWNLFFLDLQREIQRRRSIDVLKKWNFHRLCLLSSLFTPFLDPLRYAVRRHIKQGFRRLLNVQDLSLLIIFAQCTVDQMVQHSLPSREHIETQLQLLLLVHVVNRKIWIRLQLIYNKPIQDRKGRLSHKLRRRQIPLLVILHVVDLAVRLVHLVFESTLVEVRCFLMVLDKLCCSFDHLTT